MVQLSLVCIDDVILLDCSFENHLHKLFFRLLETGLKLKPSKCAFLQEEVKYLKHLISRNGVLPNPSKVEKVATCMWPTPTTSWQVQQFLRLVNYYRTFVRDFASIANPLHTCKLTERGFIFQMYRSLPDLVQKVTSVTINTPYPGFSRHWWTVSSGHWR